MPSADNFSSFAHAHLHMDPPSSSATEPDRIRERQEIQQSSHALQFGYSSSLTLDNTGGSGLNRPPSPPANAVAGPSRLSGTRSRKRRSPSRPKSNSPPQFARVGSSPAVGGALVLDAAAVPRLSASRPLQAAPSIETVSSDVAGPSRAFSGREDGIAEGTAPGSSPPTPLNVNDGGDVIDVSSGEDEGEDGIELVSDTGPRHRRRGFALGEVIEGKSCVWACCRPVQSRPEVDRRGCVHAREGLQRCRFWLASLIEPSIVGGSLSLNRSLRSHFGLEKHHPTADIFSLASPCAALRRQPRSPVLDHRSPSPIPHLPEPQQVLNQPPSRGNPLGGAFLRRGNAVLHYRPIRPSAAPPPPPSAREPNALLADDSSDEEVDDDEDNGDHGPAHHGRWAARLEDQELYRLRGIQSIFRNFFTHLRGNAIAQEWFEAGAEQLPQAHGGPTLGGGDPIAALWRSKGATADPPNLPTRRGYTRKFEIEMGGFVDSESEDEGEEVNEQSSPPPPPPVPPLLQPSNSDDDILLVYPDGTSTPTSLLPPVPPPPVTSRKRKRPLPKAELNPHLTLGCSGCARPLILGATESASRRVFVLRCGHLVDGWCLEHLAHPSGEEEAELVADAASVLAAGRKSSRKKNQPVPLFFDWECPVDGCGHVHESEGVEREEATAGSGLEWKPRMGPGAVVQVYV